MKNQSCAVRLLLGSLCVIAALMPCTASAQTNYTWTGGGSDNNWGTSGNWSAGVPVSSGNTVLVFSGSTRTSPTNNLGDWNLSIGRLEFASGAASFALGGNTFGFDPYLGSQTQQIFQNSANTQTIGVGGFSMRNGADSQINLNAGDLLISSQNLYIDSASSVRFMTVTGSDATRRTVTFAGNVNKGGTNADPDMLIKANKRALVTGSLTFGSGNDGSVFIDDGVLQFSGAGTMTGGRPVIGTTSGSGNAAVWLDTAGATFGRQLEVRDGSSGRRTIGGLNTTGTVTFSGEFVGNAGNYDLAAAAGGSAIFSGARNFNAGVFVNRPDGVSAYGGTVILSGTTNSNSFTALHAGTLQFSNFNQLGSAHFEFNAAAGDSGTLRYAGGSTTTTKELWIDNPGITRAAIDVSQAGSTLTWNPGNGAVNQNLTKTGAGGLQFGLGVTGSATVGVEAGMLILTGSSSYSGGTVVSGGTLEVSAGGGEGGSFAGLGTGSVSIASGAQVKYWLSNGSAITVANPFSLSGGTLHTTDGFNTYSGRVTLASGASTISAQYEDVITLSGGLAGSGNVLFTQSGGTGSYAAPTYVLSGTGANTGTVRVSGSSGGGATKLQLANVNALQSVTLDMAAGDTGTVEYTVAGNNTYNLGGLQGSRNLGFGSNALSIGSNGQNTTYSGNLSGSGLFTKLGSGTLTLSGNNTNSGGVAVNAGVLALGSANALGSTGTISFNGGTLQYSASNTTDYSGRFSTAANQQFLIDTNGRSVTLGSTLASENGQLVKLGTGTLTLSGSNSYGGGTFVTAGRVVATTSQAFPGDVTNNAEVEFRVDGAGIGYGYGMSGSGSLIKTGTGELSLGGVNSYTGGTVVTVGRLIGDPAALQGAIVNHATVVLGSGSTGTFTGAVSGTGAVEVVGGNVTFSGASTYTGPTMVNGFARLAVNGSLGNTALTVFAGGTLGGTGTLGGNVLIQGLHAPGNSPGSQTFNANLTYDAGAVVNWELIANTTGSAGTNYDQIIMPTGNLAFSGTTTLALAFNSAGSSVNWADAFWNVNRSWMVYDLSGGTTTGLGNLVFGGSLLDSVGNTLSPTARGYFETSLVGQDVMLNFVAVPEPSTWAMALAGLACGGFLMRRRHRCP